MIMSRTGSLSRVVNELDSGGRGSSSSSAAVEAAVADNGCVRALAGSTSQHERNNNA